MMITPIQCATMHSGLTEQEINEKYGWVIRALNEYGSRCAYDFIDGNSPEPAKHKPFIVGNVRDILDELKQEEITFGLFVEKLNAIASKFYEQSAPPDMAEALRLKWITLTEDMGRMLSGQRGVSIDKLNKVMNLVQEFVNTLPASLSSPGSGWVKQETISDGLGSEWLKKCPDCGKDEMVVVRPGKVQCNNCG